VDDGQLLEEPLGKAAWKALQVSSTLSSMSDIWSADSKNDRIPGPGSSSSLEIKKNSGRIDVVGLLLNGVTRILISVNNKSHSQQ
jgi:hypothetical protein